MGPLSFSSPEKKGQLGLLWNLKEGKSPAKTFGWGPQSKAWSGKETTVPKERVIPYNVKLTCCCFLLLLLPVLHLLGNVKKRVRACNIGL